MRDHKKLKVFDMAHVLVLASYDATRAFPSEERYGLQSQIRRAAVSVPTNIVEGCARRTQRDALNFFAIALGSATEVRYLVELAGLLGYIESTLAESLYSRYDELVRALAGFIRTLEGDLADRLKADS